MPSQQVLGIGILLIFIGFTLVFVSLLVGGEKGKSDAKVAVFGLIGPIPFGFGNDKRLFLVAMILTVVVVVITMLLLRLQK